jgi:hypothetical protein
MKAPNLIKKKNVIYGFPFQEFNRPKKQPPPQPNIAAEFHRKPTATHK